MTNSAMNNYEQQNTLVKTLFEFLDYTEESDSGIVFHPIHISCARALSIKPLEDCLSALKASVTTNKENV